ncbi:NTP transferase domain-containing protein [Candidatus Bipolaricaulota bacterium]|nr:NTP transferase domain-containing protein [Candidatus Bipolaricaulota bacterium]
MPGVFAVIMAGGRGERLWPLSTRERPKQFLALAGAGTMLQETADRIRPLVPAERMCVVALKEIAHLVREQLDVPDENILVEPMGRNTAPCLGLAAVVLRAKDPQAVMIALPADHVIRDRDRFLTIMKAAVKVATGGDYLVTLGIVPDRPAAGYGYIRRGELFAKSGDLEIYRAERFIEKPDHKTAERFIEEGGYYWNSGMFVWRVDAILKAITEQMPHLSAGLCEINAHLGRASWAEVVERVYRNLPSISIDYGVMERASNVLVIPAEIGWSDLGDWSALGAVIPSDSQGNVVRARHVGVETEGSIVYADNPERLVATVGLKDLVIVDTDQGLLVMPKARAQEVRRILELLGKQQGPE